MANIEELKKDGARFLNTTHYADLDDLAKINANTYMQGLREGMRLAEKSRDAEKKELAAV